LGLTAGRQVKMGNWNMALQWLWRLKFAGEID